MTQSKGKFLCLIKYIHRYGLISYYFATPPLGQDMTQGQFLSGV